MNRIHLTIPERADKRFRLPAWLCYFMDCKAELASLIIRKFKDKNNRTLNSMTGICTETFSTGSSGERQTTPELAPPVGEAMIRSQGIAMTMSVKLIQRVPPHLFLETSEHAETSREHAELPRNNPDVNLLESNHPRNSDDVARSITSNKCLKA